MSRDSYSAKESVVNGAQESRPLSDEIIFPNRWARVRYASREPAAEFLGTMILCIFGTAGGAQGTLYANSASPLGGWFSVPIGWGIGLGLGAWMCAGISAGHINPAVTIAFATFRGFPWRKVPVYIAAQLLGAFVGAALTYANYFHAIDLAEGGPGVRTVPGTAGIFGAYAVSYMTNVSAFWDEALGAFLLMIVILAVTDRRNCPPPPGLLPLVLALTLFGIGSTWGAQTGFAVNPARDLGPRILTAMVGYGSAVFTFRNQYWLWCGILAPIVGALLATFMYDTLIFTGTESIINYVSSSSARKIEHRAAVAESPTEAGSPIEAKMRHDNEIVNMV